MDDGRAEHDVYMSWKRANTKSCCNNCKYKMELIKFDYSRGGCEHTPYDGFACVALIHDGVVTHMVGIDPDSGMCEMFIPR